MSVESMMRLSGTIVRTTSDSRDIIGGADPATTTRTVTPCYLEPRRAGARTGEDLADRNTGIGDYLLVLPAGTDVSNFDAFEYGGRTFELVAIPREMVNARRGVVSHIEVDLQEVT